MKNLMINIKSESKIYSDKSIVMLMTYIGSKRELNLKTELMPLVDSPYLSVNQITNGTLGSDLALMLSEMNPNVTNIVQFVNGNPSKLLPQPTLTETPTVDVLLNKPKQPGVLSVINLVEMKRVAEITMLIVSGLVLT